MIMGRSVEIGPSQFDASRGGSFRSPCRSIAERIKERSGKLWQISKSDSVLTSRSPQLQVVFSTEHGAQMKRRGS